MKKSKTKKLDREQRPWLKYYGDVPANLEYEEGSMVDQVIASANKWPNNIAIYYYGSKITYKDFINRIKTCAKALKNYGVKENDKVTICMPNTPEGIIMVYAVNMVGAICNMVHPLSSEKELEFYINAVDSKYILCIDAVFEKIYKLKDGTNLKKIIVAKVSEDMSFYLGAVYWMFKGRKIKIPKNDEKVVMWEDFINGSKGYMGDYQEHRTAYDPAVILYSGGTTGSPKGILLSNLNFNALGTCCTNMIKQAIPGSTVLGILPIFHGFGLGVCIHTPLSKGMGCILIPSFSHKKFGEIIRKNQPSFIAGVPTLYEALIESDFGPNELKCVTSAICGGDALTATLRDKVNNFLADHGSSARIRVGYGLTEATGAACLSPENVFGDGIIGAPLPDMYFKIIIPGTHEEAPIGTDGEICISGPLVMMGYVNDDAETLHALRYHDDGRLWLHTGDVGYLGEDGLIYFSQRIKRIIISSGYNIYPTYLESIINTHDAVLTSTVIGIPHPYKGQVAKAFVVLKDGYKASKTIEKEIKDLLAKSVAKYALPAEYEFRDKLPTTLVGKVAFKQLEKEENEKRKNKSEDQTDK